MLTSIRWRTTNEIFASRSLNLVISAIHTPTFFRQMVTLYWRVGPIRVASWDYTVGSWRFDNADSQLRLTWCQRFLC